MKYLSSFLVALGVAIALFGAAFDFIVPGASPGVNLPQMLIIAAGLALAAAAWRLRRARRLSGVKARTFAVALLLSLITLIALEFVLTIWGIPTYFPSEVPDPDVQVSDWRICDELGCRYQYEHVVARCADGFISGRGCIINRQGFSDQDEFVVGNDFDSRFRILTLGDSYTQGFSADVGKSFVETIESMLPEAILWNTAISGSGTNRALAAFHSFAPKLKPQLTILGFVMNDFRDNALSRDNWILLEGANGATHLVRRYHFDRWGNEIEIPAKVAYAYASLGYIPPVSELERAIGLTRLGTLALRILDGLGVGSLDESIENQLRLTTNHLTRLRDSASAQETTLLVLLVPRKGDMDEVSELYLTAIGVMEDLEIPYLDPRHILDPASDYAPPPDGHWSNSGHQKIGAVLAECIQAFIASGDLKNCDNVIVPT